MLSAQLLEQTYISILQIDTLIKLKLFENGGRAARESRASVPIIMIDFCWYGRVFYFDAYFN